MKLSQETKTVLITITLIGSLKEKQIATDLLSLETDPLSLENYSANIISLIEDTYEYGEDSYIYNESDILLMLLNYKLSILELYQR